MLRQRENFAKPGRVSGKRVASVASETTQVISTIDQAALQLRTVAMAAQEKMLTPGAWPNVSRTWREMDVVRTQGVTVFT
jgi:hypothetical protein